MNRREHYLGIVKAAFPELAEKLRLFWGNQEFVDLIHELLHDTRGNTRKGFPINVLNALCELEEVHLETHPQIRFSDGGRWKLNAR
jgi:hypothetical protein